MLNFNDYQNIQDFLKNKFDEKNQIYTLSELSEFVKEARVKDPECIDFKKRIYYPKYDIDLEYSFTYTDVLLSSRYKIHYKKYHSNLFSSNFLYCVVKTLKNNISILVTKEGPFIFNPKELLTINSLQASKRDIFFPDKWSEWDEEVLTYLSLL